MEQIKGPLKYAVLLCGLRENTPLERLSPLERRSPEFFQELFVNENADGLNHYWHDASHGTISLAGSEVFGWRELPQSLNDFRNMNDRLGRIRIAAEHFAAPGPDQVDFRSFDGIIVVTDQGVDLTGGRGPFFMELNGETRGYRVVICSQKNSHSDIAHEMGHSFGLDHAFSMNPRSCSPPNDGRPGAYCDLWDIMGGRLAAPSKRFGSSGPLVNAAIMRLLGWLHESRIRRFIGNADSFTLRPLSRPDLQGDLAVEFDDWVIEFRIDEGWDAGFGRPGVLIRRLVNEIPPQVPGDQHSVVLGFPAELPAQRVTFELGGRSVRTVPEGTVQRIDPTNAEFLAQGATFEQGDARFGPYRRVTVQHIDPTNETATVSLLRKQPVGMTDELGILQWIIEGVLGISPQGTVVKVPPREPIRDMLIGIAVNELAETLTSSAERDALRHASLQLIAETAKREMER
jgi:hypothetical protein